MDENKGFSLVAIGAILLLFLFLATCICGGPTIGYLLQGM